MTYRKLAWRYKIKDISTFYEIRLTWSRGAYHYIRITIIKIHVLTDHKPIAVLQKDLRQSCLQPSHFPEGKKKNYLNYLFRLSVRDESRSMYRKKIYNFPRNKKRSVRRNFENDGLVVKNRQTNDQSKYKYLDCWKHICTHPRTIS